MVNEIVAGRSISYSPVRNFPDAPRAPITAVIKVTAVQVVDCWGKSNGYG